MSSYITPDPRPRPEVPEVRDWSGPAAPIVKTGGDYWKPKPLLDLIWSSIILILGTQIGTRVMLRTFGSRVPELVFEPNDEILDALARRYTIDAISEWEDRVSIQEVYTNVVENSFTIGIIFVVYNVEGVYEGNLSVYRNQSFNALEQYYNRIS